jgi:hypothetical protein
MTNPTNLLASASLLDLTSYTEHRTGCPEWYVRHGIGHPATQGKLCDCGLAEQLRAVEEIVGFVRRAAEQAAACPGLTAADLSRLEFMPYEWAAMNTIMWADSKRTASYSTMMKTFRLARRAGLVERRANPANRSESQWRRVRACAEVDAAGKGVV